VKFFLTLREPINGLIHFFGLLLSIIGLIILLHYSTFPQPRLTHQLTFSVFCLGLISLYTISTLYHWLNVSDKTTQTLRKFDHIMINILIAATYTPVCLIALRGNWGWGLFISIWVMCFVGIFLDIACPATPRWLRTFFYVLMGWLVIVGLLPVVRAVGWGGFTWLLLGGLSYTLGALVYALKKPDPWPKIFGFHEIFHVMVVCGSLFHFGLMYFYILPFPV